MRPGLIGERCEAGAFAGTLVMWDSGDDYLQGLILLDDGTLRLMDWSTLRFQPRTEQPDELREAAGNLLHLLTMADIAGSLHVDMPTREAIVRLQESLQ